MMESHFVSERDAAKEEKIRKNRPKIISIF